MTIGWHFVCQRGLWIKREKRLVPAFRSPCVRREFSLGAGLFRDDSQDDCGNPFELMSMRLGERMLDIFFEECLLSRAECSDHHFLLPSHKF
jgi:hypothetical protein